MARITFRQGIISHQLDGSGNQNFLSLTGGFVTLRVSPDPTVITFIHKDKDYLYSERQTITNAWGPVTIGTNYWLYWRLNKVTGVREFGQTTVEPVEAAAAPTIPTVGSFWFNTVNKVWLEWTGSSWTEAIVVFACKLDTGGTPRSMSINAPDFRGTQVGIQTTARPGGLAFDATGQPIRTGDGRFFTTEDIFTTGVATGASLRVNNILIPGICQQPIAAYMVVEYSDFYEITPASPYTQGVKAYGIVEEDAVTGEVVNFVTEGMIFNELWDWSSAQVNQPVYIDSSGLITLTAIIPEQLPVGVVIGPQEILFSPRLFPQIDATVTVPLNYVELEDTNNSYVGHGGKALSVKIAEDGVEFVPFPATVWGGIIGTISNQTDLQSELDLKSDDGHTHVKTDITDFAHVHAVTDVTGLQTTLLGKVGRAGDTMLSAANLIFSGGGEVTGLPAVPSGDTAASSKKYVDDQILGVSLGTIIDGDTDTWVTVENNPGVDSDKISMQIGLSVNYEVAGTGGDVFVVDGTGIMLESPSAIATADLPGMPISIQTGAGDQTGKGGDITIATGAGGVSGLGGNINLIGGDGDTGGHIDLEPGDGTQAGAVRLKRLAANKAAELLFFEGNDPTSGDQYIGFKAPDDISTATTGNGLTTVWTLPTGDGISGQTLVTDGVGALRWETPAIASPTQELCRPYDVGLHSPGAIPTSTIVMKTKFAQKVILLDYGHQADAEGMGGSVASHDEFEVRLNGVAGTLLGTIGFKQNEDPVIDITMTTINVGDTIYVVSPAAPDVSLEDVAITLRGIMEPAVPQGTLTVAFGSPIYDPPGLGGISDVVITGEYTHVEWAVLEYSLDNITYYPMDKGWAVSSNNLEGLLMSFNGSPIQFRENSFYYETDDYSPSNIDDLVANLYFKVRLSAFGPAGMATDTAIIKPDSGG